MKYKILNEQINFKIGIVSYEKIEEYKKYFYDSLIDDISSKKMGKTGDKND